MLAVDGSTQSWVWKIVLQQGKVPLTRMLAPGAMGESEQHSAEFDAVNKLLNRGSKPEDIVLSTTVLMWPEEGPTP